MSEARVTRTCRVCAPTKGALYRQLRELSEDVQRRDGCITELEIFGVTPTGGFRAALAYQLRLSHPRVRSA